MKKRLIGLLVICLLLECILGFAAADSAIDDAATSGVDVVVVLDMSGSMQTQGNLKGNDVNGFRLDATAMLIGMMDMDGSRIGIVPFAGTVFGNGIKELTKVNDAKSRDDLIKDLYERIARLRGDGTNTGAPLMTALHMLDSREDKSNRPMIILMTDGKNTINNPINVSPSYHWENNEIVDKGKESFTTDLANQVTQEAADCAVAKGVPIYTVSLTVDPYAPTQGLNLSTLSSITGLKDGCCWAKTKEDAKDIPEYFAKILADKIGSSVQIISRPRLVEGTQKTYEVAIPVLNESILEINVILPVKKSRANIISGIDSNTIRVYNKNGDLQSDGDGVTILRSDSGSFAMIKIRKPKHGLTGMWKLQFDSETDPAAISFNFLYNYTIKLNASAKTNRTEDDKLFKSDKLELNAFFTDENGNKTDDASLYSDHTGEENYEDWMTIRANWQLYELDGEGRTADRPAREGTLAPQDTPLCFATEIDLSENTPKAGQYKLIFNAEGAGLLRKVELPFTLENHPPKGENYQYSINVNSTTKGEESTWTVEGSSGVLPKKAGDLVKDVDPEDQKNMYFKLVPATDAEQAATLTLENDGTIRYTTILNGSAIRDGEAKYKLEYDDGDKNGQGSVLISLFVNSDVAALMNEYEPELTVSGKNAVGSSPDDGIYQKNTPLQIRLQLKKKGGSGYADAELIGRLANRLAIVDQKTGEPAIEDTQFTLNEDALEYTLESTGNKGAKWTVNADIGPFKASAKEITVVNENDPVPAASESITLNCSGEKVPGFLRSIIGEDTAEDDPLRMIKVSSLFSDQDNDLLEYSTPEFKTPDGSETMDPAAITAVARDEEQSGEYLIQMTGTPTSIFNFSYQSKLEVEAIDGDGRKAIYEQEITVVDLFNKMLTYLIVILIAIVILVILILIIHQIRKPRFPKLNMTIREEPSLYESGSETLSPVKSPTNANAIGVDSDMAAKHNISMEFLQNIIIRPIRSTTSVGVCCRKAVPGHEVSLADVVLKPKKKYIWRLDEELSIRSLNGDGLVAIKLEDRRDEQGNDPTSDFGEMDEWAEVRQEQGAKSSSKKHSRKVDRKEAPVKEETVSSNTDDFDF